MLWHGWRNQMVMSKITLLSNISSTYAVYWAIIIIIWLLWSVCLCIKTIRIRGFHCIIRCYNFVNVIVLALFLRNHVEYLSLYYKTYIPLKFVRQSESNIIVYESMIVWLGLYLTKDELPIEYNPKQTWWVVAGCLTWMMFDSL